MGKKKKKLQVIQIPVFSRCCSGIQKKKRMKWFVSKKEIIYKQKSRNCHSYITLLQKSLNGTDVIIF